jgi:hypothetical protein
VLLQTTTIPDFRGFPCSKSPLTDSNRRPPPYHGGLPPRLWDLRNRLVKRFPCNSAGFSACTIPSVSHPEPPRKPLNLSPKPSPREFVLCASARNGLRPGRVLGVCSRVLHFLQRLHRASQAGDPRADSAATSRCCRESAKCARRWRSSRSLTERGVIPSSPLRSSESRKSRLR